MTTSVPPATVKHVAVLGRTMAYREVGAGDPILFLHGNPTSSFLWRGVLGHLAPLGRCIAPDLIGMGRSAKLPGRGDERYRFVQHRRYLDGLVEQLSAGRRITIVAHDWGAVLGFDWARRHPSEVRGIAYLETLVAPVSSTSENAPDPDLFGALRSERGEQLVLDDNVFLEQVLPAGTLRRLRDHELAEYRRPYLAAGEGRRPMLTWAREIPIDGEPDEVHHIVTANEAFMTTTDIPKLLIVGRPGALLTGELLERCRSWPNQREVAVPGLHFLPEDASTEIAAAVTGWLTSLPA